MDSLVAMGFVYRTRRGANSGPDVPPSVASVTATSRANA